MKTSTKTILWVISLVGLILMEFTILAPLGRLFGEFLCLTKMVWFDQDINNRIAALEQEENADKDTVLTASLDKETGVYVVEMEAPPKFPKGFTSVLISVEDKWYENTFVLSHRIVFQTFGLLVGNHIAGSGIVMQLSRDFVLKDVQRTFSRKLKEILVSYVLASTYTKEELLYAYQKTVFLGPVRGFHNASEVYLGKNISNVSLREALQLVALLPGPYLYKLNADWYKNRVAMLAGSSFGVSFQSLEELQFESIKSRDQGINDVVSSSLGVDVKFGDTLTIDPVIQHQHYESLRRAIEWANNHSETDDWDGFSITLNRDGKVKTYIPSLTGPTNVFEASTAYTPGSVIKIFLYASFFNDHTLNTELPAADDSLVFWQGDTPKYWNVSNYHKGQFRPGATVPAWLALAQSLNVPSAYLALHIKEQEKVKWINSLGISGTPASFIGAENTSPLRIVKAATSFLNSGYPVETLNIVSHPEPEYGIPLINIEALEKTFFSLHQSIYDPKGTAHLLTKRMSRNELEHLYVKTGTGERNSSASVLIVNKNTGTVALLGLYSKGNKSGNWKGRYGGVSGAFLLGNLF